MILLFPLQKVGLRKCEREALVELVFGQPVKGRRKGSIVR